MLADFVIVLTKSKTGIYLQKRTLGAPHKGPIVDLCNESYALDAGKEVEAHCVEALLDPDRQLEQRVRDE